MLSAHYIKEVVPKELYDRYSQLELDLILAFAERARAFVGSGVMPYTAEWQAQKLQSLGILREDAERIIAASWPGTQRELQATLDAAGYRSLAYDERIYRSAVEAGLLAAAPPMAESVVLRRILQAGYGQAINKFNLTNTTAENALVASFTAAIDSAYLQVASGYNTLRNAVWGAVNELAGKGVTGAVFANGRTMEMAPYVRMVTVTTVGNTTRQMSFERAREFGSDLIEVSAHAGARPRCAPFQGKVFSLSGKHPKYPALSSTSYGEAAGLFGINCGHYPFPLIEGLDEAKTAKEIEAETTVDGKSNEQVYAQSQDQRYLERKIRSWKHKADALEKADIDSKRARDKVKYWQGEMRRFIENTDRTRRYDREKSR